MHPRSPEFYTGPLYLPLLNRGSGFELSVLFELFCSFYSVIFCCILGVSVVLFALCPRGVWPGQNKTTSIINWRGVGSSSPPPRSRNSSTTWGIAAINHPHSMLGNMPQQLEDSNFLAGLCSSQIIFYFVDCCLNCIFESFLFIFSSVPQFVLFSLSWCLVSRHFSSCYTVLLYMFFGFNS